jgi:hypothetical protein
MRTRIMNQLQALAMNEGYRWKKKLFSEQGRAQLEKLALAPWASRRRQEFLSRLPESLRNFPMTRKAESLSRSAFFSCQFIFHFSSWQPQFRFLGLMFTD